MQTPLNVLGKPLELCSLKPITGYYRDGTCNSRNDNTAYHAICIYASEEFLKYSKEAGNDISTPMLEYNFSGVKAGQCWCLSGHRFAQAIKDGMAPKIFLYSTHERMLELIDLEILKKYALDI